jgi:hypothetical protein
MDDGTARNRQNQCHKRVAEPEILWGAEFNIWGEFRACRGGNGIREEEPRREQAVLVHDGTFSRADFARIHFHRFYTGGVIVL